MALVTPRIAADNKAATAAYFGLIASSQPAAVEAAVATRSMIFKMLASFIIMRVILRKENQLTYYQLRSTLSSQKIPC